MKLFRFGLGLTFWNQLHVHQCRSLLKQEILRSVSAREVTEKKSPKIKLIVMIAIPIEGELYSLKTTIVTINIMMNRLSSLVNKT